MDMVRENGVVPDEIKKGLLRSSILEGDTISYRYQVIILKQGKPGPGNTDHPGDSSPETPATYNKIRGIRRL